MNVVASRAGRVRTVLVALVALVVTGVAAVTAVSGMPAAAATGCVALVVDAHLLDGSAVEVRCAKGDPSSGFETLQNAGVSYEVRARDGLLCRLDGKPECTDTTSSRYWSYWVRPPGAAAWQYAAEGPAGHDPEPCSGEAWVWQDGGRVAPPRVPAATGCSKVRASPRITSAPPRSSPSTTSRPASTRDTGRPRTTTKAGGGTSPSATSAEPAKPGRSSRTPRTTPSPTSSSTSSATPISGPAGTTSAGVVVPPDAEPPADSGAAAIPPAAGALLGLLVVLALGAAAVVRGRRS